VKALAKGYSNIQNALGEIQDDEMQKPEARHEATTLFMSIQYLETTIMCIVWNTLLPSFDATSKQLESIYLCPLFLLWNRDGKYLRNLKNKRNDYLALTPGGKNFENAPKFKCSPQNNGISAAFLKQLLCETSMYSKYLPKYN
jgi:hypothetical protein